jgi:hypothetical protein
VFKKLKKCSKECIFEFKLIYTELSAQTLIANGFFKSAVQKTALFTFRPANGKGYHSPIRQKALLLQLQVRLWFLVFLTIGNWYKYYLENFYNNF